LDDAAAPALLEDLRQKSEDVGLSVRMVSGMMTGVADSLGQVAGELNGYERAVEKVHHSSITLGAEMAELVRLARKVDGVLQLIEHIALQTRVLSLNATLEAARAGEAGRGFKVVASSVKELAKQTNEATGEIRTALSGILVAAEHATGHGAELDGSIDAVRNLTRGMVAQLQEQAQVAVAAAKYVDEAANGVDSVALELSRASATQVQEAVPTHEAVPTEEQGAASCH
jgi:methyl-accepting chemotaxis protein